MKVKESMIAAWLQDCKPGLEENQRALTLDLSYEK
jgi:hypothetical protein